MIKRINRFFPCYVAFYLLSSFVFSYILAVTNASVPLWGRLVISQVIVLAPVLVYALIFKINIVKAMPYRKIKPLDAFLSLLLGYMLIPLVLLINAVSMMFSTNHMNSTISTLTEYPFIIQIILIALMPALVEELIFRGFFYHSYRKNGILGAALVSGIVFGIMHMNINQFCYATVLGIIFALIVEATGNMWGSVLAHFAINTYSITIMKILSLAGLDIETLTASSAQVQQDVTVPGMTGEQVAAATRIGTVIGFVIGIVMLLAIVAAFTALAVLILRAIARRNGRWEYFKANIRYGFKRRNNESFVTIPYIATVVAMLAYMIFMEL